MGRLQLLTKEKSKRIMTEQVLLHPTYFPSIAQFHLILSYPCVLEVSDNYQKQTLRNRAYIYGANGKQALNLPIKHVGGENGRQLFKDVKVENHFPWQRLHWKNGKQDGAQELYYATGALRIRWNMVQDVVEGEMATFFTTGAKRLAGDYVKGKREGYWTTWDIDGRIEDQTEYRNGIATNAAERARQQDSILEALLNNAGKIPELDADERLNY